jgi:hypothetical protein
MLYDDRLTRYNLTIHVVGIYRTQVLDTIESN